METTQMPAADSTAGCRRCSLCCRVAKELLPGGRGEDDVTMEVVHNGDGFKGRVTPNRIVFCGKSYIEMDDWSQIVYPHILQNFWACLYKLWNSARLLKVAWGSSAG